MDNARPNGNEGLFEQVAAWLDTLFRPEEADAERVYAAERLVALSREEREALENDERWTRIQDILDPPGELDSLFEAAGLNPAGAPDAAPREDAAPEPETRLTIACYKSEVATLVGDDEDSNAPCATLPVVPRRPRDGDGIEQRIALCAESYREPFERPTLDQIRRRVWTGVLPIMPLLWLAGELPDDEPLHTAAWQEILHGGAYLSLPTKFARALRSILARSRPTTSEWLLTTLRWIEGQCTLPGSATATRLSIEKEYFGQRREVLRRATFAEIMDGDVLAAAETYVSLVALKKASLADAIDAWTRASADPVKASEALYAMDAHPTNPLRFNDVLKRICNEHIHLLPLSSFSTDDVNAMHAVRCTSTRDAWLSRHGG